MDLKSELLKAHSKNHAEYIADYIGNDQQRFDALIKLFSESEYRITQRAAWPMGICAKRYPDLLKPHLTPLIRNLKNDVHDAVKRNTVRALQDVDIPESLMGEAADICFDFLASQKEAIAIKVFSMTILLNIVKKVPELKQELKILIEDQMPYGSPGFISRGKKVLKALDKIPD